MFRRQGGPRFGGIAELDEELKIFESNLQMRDRNPSIIAFDARSLSLCNKKVALSSLPATMSLQSLPGANRIHVSLCMDGEILSQVQFPAENREKIVIRVASDPMDNLYVTSPGRDGDIIFGSTLDPASPIQNPVGVVGIDVVLVFDGTIRVNLSHCLFGPNDILADYVSSMRRFLEKVLDSYESVRLCVLAFGDQPMPATEVKADELQPSYQLHPQRKEDRRFRSLDLDAASESIHGIPPTPGGDFVDALADALFAAGSLHWRPNARRLLVLTGDSPGHSTEFPVHPGGDICVRERDVDVEAMRLHRQGVEILTVYYDPAPSEIGLEQLKGRGLLDDARRQYRRLASLPEMAFVASAFDPVKAAEVVLNRPPLIGRGASYGILLEEGDAALPAMETMS